jgi:hypothetical protein
MRSGKFHWAEPPGCRYMPARRRFEQSRTFATMPSPQYILFFLLSTIFCSAVLSQEDAYPEVVPGPGLPSIASVNLTTADLYNMPLPSNSLPSVITTNALRSFSNTCSPADNAYTNVNNLIACYHCLSSLAGWRCNVKGGPGYLPNNWCQTGDA